jgi:hypothetical protein
LGEIREIELDIVVLGDCSVGEKREKREEGGEYLRAENSSLNSTDKKGEVREELAAIVLGGCYVE